MNFLPKNKYLKWSVISLLIISIGLFVYQINSYKTSKTGMKYRFIEGGELKEQLGPENYCLVEFMIIGPENDTLQNCFHDDTLKEIPYPVEAHNELMEALQITKPGSTIEVLISTDSLKQKISNHYKIKLLPNNELAKFIIRVDKVLNAQQYEAYVNAKKLNRAIAENKIIDEYCAKNEKDGVWLLDSFQSIKYRVKDTKSGAFVSQTNLMSMPPVLFHATIIEYDVVVSTLKGGLIYDSKLEGRRYKAEQMANLNGLKVLDFLPFFVNEGSIGEFVTTSDHGFGAYGRIGVPSYAPLYVKISNVKVIQ